MFCTNCGRPMEKDKQECLFCKDLPELSFNYCQNCGEKMVGDSSICTQCEEKIKRQKNFERNTSQSEEENTDVKDDYIRFIRKRSAISMVLWILITALQIIAVVFIYDKLYPFYISPLFNILLFIRSLKYFTSCREDLKSVVRNINKRSENAEILIVGMMLVGLIIGAIPAYFDLKTQKKVMSKKNILLK